MLDLCVNPPAAISFFPLSLHDALPISPPSPGYGVQKDCFPRAHLTVFRTACEKIGTFVPPRRTGPFSDRADGRTHRKGSALPPCDHSEDLSFGLFLRRCSVLYSTFLDIFCYLYN